MKILFECCQGNQQTKQRRATVGSHHLLEHCCSKKYGVQLIAYVAYQIRLRKVCTAIFLPQTSTYRDPELRNFEGVYYKRGLNRVLNKISVEQTRGKEMLNVKIRIVPSVEFNK